MKIVPRHGPATPWSDTHICCVILGRHTETNSRSHFDTGSPQAYDTSKKLIFKLTPDRTTTNLSVAELAAAGFMSAIPTTLITAPVERAKVLLQVSMFLSAF